jgi:hypothetical protein
MGVLVVPALDQLNCIPTDLVFLTGAQILEGETVTANAPRPDLQHARVRRRSNVGGGVPSGMDAYHGEGGFKSLSHVKGVFTQSARNSCSRNIRPGGSKRACRDGPAGGGGRRDHGTSSTWSSPA